MAESPENKNSENTLFMRLSVVFLTIRGNKKRKKSKKVEKSFKKLLTSCSSSDNMYLADARESEQQRPDKRSEKLDN